MRSRWIRVNLNACMRVVLVSVASYVLAYFFLGMVRQVFLAVHSLVGYASWQVMADYMGIYRSQLRLLCVVGSVALFSRWILRPVFDDFAGLVTASLRLEEDGPEGEEPPVRFPKGLERIQQETESLRRELKLWKYAVQEAEQRKDDLVVYLAHDIRTPLTSVLGYLELLDEHPELPEDQRAKYTGIALRKARRMQSLVDELFEITRFNVGQIELERRPVNAEILLRQLAEEITPAAQARGIAVRVENAGVEQIVVDPDKMARALDNILGNAAHYAEEGGEILVRLDRDPENRVRIRISNTGADIPPEKLQRFFEKFYRADPSRDSGTGRSGLGLAIAKNIVEAHGGEIAADNRDGVTTFTVLL